MTIKELEALVGMTRANIRFYEQEGLISPGRQPNGYQACQEGERESWESGETYVLADAKVWRCWAYVGIDILDIGLAVLILHPDHTAGRV